MAVATVFSSEPDLLRFLSHFQADSWLKSEWIEPFDWVEMLRFRQVESFQSRLYPPVATSHYLIRLWRASVHPHAQVVINLH